MIEIISGFFLIYKQRKCTRVEAYRILGCVQILNAHYIWLPLLRFAMYNNNVV